MKKLFLLFIISIIGINTEAQELKLLAEYSEKLPEFENWLTENGLSQVLSVHNLEIDEGEFEVYLAFKKEDTDWASMAWEELKIEFEQSKNYKLEEYLFFNMASIFKIPLPNSNIQIYDTYNESVQPCLYIGIWFDKEKRAVQTENSFCKAKTAEVSINIESLKNIKSVKIDLENEKTSKKQVYTKILAMAERYFKSKVPDFENDFFSDYAGNEAILEFEVKNLRQEILYEDDDWLCSSLKWIYEDFDCDLRKKEFVKFKIEYKSSSEGIFINTSVDGRYASSGTNKMIWERGSLMEPELESYVSRYAKKFKKMIQKELEK